MGEVSSGVGPPHTSGSCRWDDMGLYGTGISYMGPNGSSLGYNWEFRGSRSAETHGPYLPEASASKSSMQLSMQCSRMTLIHNAPSAQSAEHTAHAQRLPQTATALQAGQADRTQPKSRQAGRYRVTNAGDAHNAH